MLSSAAKKRIADRAHRDAKRLAQSIEESDLPELEREQYFRRFASSLIWRADQIRDSQPPVQLPDPTDRSELMDWYRLVWKLPKNAAYVLRKYDVFPSDLRGLSKQEIDDISEIGPIYAQLIFEAVHTYPQFGV